MVFDLFDFGNSFSYTKNSPIIFANQNYTGFVPSLHSEKKKLPTQAPVCGFLAAGPVIRDAIKPLLTYSSLSSESLVLGSCWLFPRGCLTARGKSKGTNEQEAPVPSSLLSTGDSHHLHLEQSVKFQASPE